MRFTIRQIEYFIATAETGSITLASERLNISQPSISTAITHLEQELDTQLFVRHHAKGLSLTGAGHGLLAEAKRLVEQAEYLYTLAGEVGEKARGLLSLGCFVTLAPMIMPELSFSFTSAFPAARIAQVVTDHQTLLDKLQRAELDVAITYDLLVPNGFDFVPLARLPPHILVSDGHPFSHRPSVALEDLVEEPLLLLDLPISREYFLNLFADRGLKPTIAARLPHQDVIRTMVANGYGYTLANVRPRANVALDGRPVVRVALTGEHKPMVLGLVSVRQNHKRRLLDSFERHCRSVISDAYIPGMDAPLMGGHRAS